MFTIRKYIFKLLQLFKKNYMIKIFEKFDLKNLSPNEIKILRAFLYFEIDILQLPLFDKTIQNLESKMIIKKVPKHIILLFMENYVIIKLPNMLVSKSFH